MFSFTVLRTMKKNLALSTVGALLAMGGAAYAAPTDGHFDTSYGTGYPAPGYSGVMFGGNYVYSTNTGVAVDSQDRVILLGNGKNYPSVTRLTASGLPDSSFAASLGFAFSAGTKSSVMGLAVQSDDKILAAVNFDDQCFTLVRLNTDGSPDSTFAQGAGGASVCFGLQGVVSKPLPSQIAIGPDGSIVVAGSVTDLTSGSNTIFLAKFSSAGIQDQTFGTPNASTVFVLYAPNVNNNATALTVVSDGSIFVGTNGYKKGCMAKFTRTGSVDSTFGDSGRICRTDDTDPSTTGGKTTAIIDLGNGDVAACMSYDSATVLVTAYNKLTGSVDTAFGSAGYFVTGGIVGQTATMLKSGNRLVVVASSNSNNVETTTRWSLTGQLDTTYGTYGTAVGLFPISWVVRGVAVQSNGKVIVSGNEGPQLGMWTGRLLTN